MTNETLTLIEKLAAQLGQSSETLIGWFAMRAYWEWMDVLMLAVAIALLLLSGRYAIEKCTAAKDEDKSFSFAVVAVISWILAAFCAFALMLDAHQAIMATASPNAYAFEEILKAITEAKQ